MRLNVFKGNPDAADSLDPPRDPIFTYLYSRVVQGRLPLYQAEIPIGMIQLFSKLHEPHKTAVGRKALVDMAIVYQSGQLNFPLWVYPQDGSKFILSDDYLPYFLLVELGVKSYWCEVMGDFEQQGILGVRGPAPQDYVRSLPGGPDYDQSAQTYQVIQES